MKIGIICDLDYARHHLFQSYYYAVKNIYETTPVLVKSEADLKGVDILFIGDDHYHKDWINYIDYCNKNQIRVVVLTNEKVKNSFFPWNETNLQLLNKFKYLYHYMNDVDDCMEYKCLLNRTAPSFHFRKQLVNNIQKKYNYMIFIGKTKCPNNSYKERNEILAKLDLKIKIDIYNVDIPSWEAYVNLISKYKFVFSPIGNGNFFPMRFYEGLCVGAIPVHQVRENTLSLYEVESRLTNVIYFQNTDELAQKIKDFEEPMDYSCLWMEDTLSWNLKIDNLI